MHKTLLEMSTSDGRRYYYLVDCKKCLRDDFPQVLTDEARAQIFVGYEEYSTWRVVAVGPSAEDIYGRYMEYCTLARSLRHSGVYVNR